MRKFAMVLASAACVGLAAPAFAATKQTSGKGTPQMTAAVQSAQCACDDFSARGKKKKKNVMNRSSWGG